MSYGKDPAQLGNVIPFGGTHQQQVAMASARPPRQSSGNRPYWVDTFEPSEHTPDIIRCIPGQYEVEVLDQKSGNAFTTVLPWLPFTEHFSGVHKRGAICSGGVYRMVKGKRQPCHGCDIFWEDFDIRKMKKANGDTSKGPNRMSMRDAYAITVIDYSVYYKVEQIDRSTGQMRMNNQGQPFYEWVKPDSPQQAMQYANRESKQGATLPWVLGKDHWDALNAYVDYIGQSCVGCGQMQCIAPLAWCCPQCKDPVIDFRSSTLSMDQVNAIVRSVYQCRCGFMGLLTEAVQCRHCSQPKRAGLYDVDIQLKRVRGTDPNKKGTQLQFFAHSAPGPLHPGYAALATPLDLKAKFAPTPLEEQARLFQVFQQAQQQPMPGYPPQYQTPQQYAAPQYQMPQQAPGYPTQQQFVHPTPQQQPAQQAPQPYDPSQYIKPYGSQ